MKKDRSDLVLLDINVLLALAWPNHQFHSSATQRLERRKQRWATCALTQLGFIRLSCNPAAVTDAVSPLKAASLLAQLVQDGFHEYLSNSPAPAGVADAFGRILGHQQVTDAYLIAFARASGARLLTFDARLKNIEHVELLL
ncbi:MAG: PIN domain-containing protein [Bryobacterales bacterium]|nr:PIN domain-containing protein [Bryobacterales bacterium]MBV9397191.1 PIN domain-containing protein [Bryobacterales bacterium]